MSLVLTWPYEVAEDSAIVATYKGVPMSKARARRSSNGHFYTPKTTVDYENAIGLLLKSSMRGAEPDAVGQYALRCLFYRPDRRRMDCDNMIKAISDAATGVVWKDDAQVVEVIGRLYRASDNPRAEILIHAVADPATARPLCPVCGKTIKTYPSVSATHCSMKQRSGAGSYWEAAHNIDYAPSGAPWHEVTKVPATAATPIAANHNGVAPQESPLTGSSNEWRECFTSARRPSLSSSLAPTKKRKAS